MGNRQNSIKEFLVVFLDFEHFIYNIRENNDKISNFLVKKLITLRYSKGGN